MKLSNVNTIFNQIVKFVDFCAIIYINSINIRQFHLNYIKKLNYPNNIYQ